MSAITAQQEASATGSRGKTYNFLQDWIHNAPLTFEELGLIDKIEQHVQSASSPQATTEDGKQQPQPQSAFDDANGKHHVLPTEESFYDSLTDRYNKDEDDELIMSLIGDDINNNNNNDADSLLRSQYQKMRILREYKQICEEILGNVNNTLALIDSIKAQYDKVSATTTQLHLECQHLLNEKDKLATLYGGIAGSLKYFEGLDRFTRELSSSTIDVLSTHFIETLQELDSCINFLTIHHDYRDAKLYLVRYRHLQNRGLAAIRDHVLTTFKSATEQIKAQNLAEMTPTQETSLLHVKFRIIAENLKVLIRELEKRASRKDCMVFLTDCFDCYYNQRKNLLFGPIQARINKLAQTRDLIQLVRHGCPYLIQVCIEEYQLFKHFFFSTPMKPEQDLFDLEQQQLEQSPQYIQIHAGMKELLVFFCTVIYEALRSLVIHENDLDVLSDLVDILRNEVLIEGIKSRMTSSVVTPASSHRGYLSSGSGSGSTRSSRSASSASSVVSSVAAHSARSYQPQQKATVIENALSAFEPVVHKMIQDAQERLIYRASIYIRDEIRSYQPSANDLNYPEILQAAAAAAASETAKTTLPKASSSGSLTSVTSAMVMAPPLRSMYQTWYPTLEKTLSFLSKLYRSLESGVFEGLAQAAVAVCTQSFIDASKKISEQKSVMDGQLFLIKHLLILRDQILPFDVSFATTEKLIDFSHIREGLSKFLSGYQTVGFKISTLIQDIMGQNKPIRVMESHLDSRKDLEKQLKTVCESFILNATRLAFDPVLTILKKVSAHRIAYEGKENPPPPDVKLEEVQDALDKVSRAFDEVLAPLDAKMALYLANPTTQAILFRPIKSNIIEAYHQFCEFVAAHFSDTDRIQLTEKMLSIDELALRLDTSSAYAATTPTPTTTTTTTATSTTPT